jgi:cell shape-determining protein MreC
MKMFSLPVKMNNLPPLRFHKRRPRRFLSILSIALGAAVLIFAAHSFFPGTFSGFFMSVGSPIWQARASVALSFSGVGSYFQTHRSLEEENERLRVQVRRSSLTALERDLLAEENNDLKELMGRQRFEQTTLAAILARPTVSPYDTFIIDVGEADGIRRDELVIADGIVVIGFVEEVFTHTSRVLLFSAPGISHEVLIGPNATPAEAVGQGGGNFRTELPRGLEIKEGDPVVIPSIDTEIFGVVGKIIVSASEPFQEILFTNPINMNDIRYVEVSRKAITR